MASSVWQFSGVRGQVSYRGWLLALFVMHSLLLLTLYGLIYISVQLAPKIPAAPGVALIMAFPIQLAWGFAQWPITVIQAQRWKDIGRSGWLATLSLIPFLGWIFAIYLLFPQSKSDPGG